MSFISDLFSAKRFIVKVFLIAFLLYIIYFVFVNKHYYKNKFIPYKDLNHKIVGDEIDLEDFGFKGEANELFLIDTVSLSFRQITYDGYFKSNAVINLEENRVYFKSNQPPRQKFSSDNPHNFYYDLSANKIIRIE